MSGKLFVQGMGVTTVEWPRLAGLMAAVAPRHAWRARAEEMEAMDEEKVAGMEVVAALGVRAVHEALAMAGEGETSNENQLAPPTESGGFTGGFGGALGEKTGMVFVSGWGMVDATVGYLESMLAEGGKYASPRHFSRSVYSSGPSVMAIALGIRGPCETLVFDDEPVMRALARAEAMLEMERAERVVVCWADQAGEIVSDLARRAAEKLGKREYRRYVEEGVGQGATAMVVARERGKWGLEWGMDESFNLNTIKVKPFPMDAAVRAAAGWLARTAGE